MPFARVKDGAVEFPLSQRQVRNRCDAENISLPPDDLSGADLSHLGFVWVAAPDLPTEAPAPLHAWALTLDRAYGDLTATWKQVPRNAETIAARWDKVREERDARLSASDWTQLADVQAGFSAAQKRAWKSYRQALRDITLGEDPWNVPWPALPEVASEAS